MTFESTKSALGQGITNRICRFFLALSLVFTWSIIAAAQQRPLLTEDVDIIKQGVIRIETGVEFLQNQQFPLSGLRGDLMRLGDTRLSFGIASNVEFQSNGLVRNFLSIDSLVPPRFRDVGCEPEGYERRGDAKLWMRESFE